MRPTIVLLLLAGCATPVTPAGPDPEPEAAQVDSAAARTTYRDMGEYLDEKGLFDSWIGVRNGLVDAFNNICGDTFCDGDYGFLQSLNLSCSVSATAGHVRACVWTFAGNYTTVNASTGAISVTSKVWTCNIPIVTGTTTTDLLAVFTATGTSDLLHRPLPRGTATVYDALLNCDL